VLREVKGLKVLRVHKDLWVVKGLKEP